MFLASLALGAILAVPVGAAWAAHGGELRVDPFVMGTSDGDVIPEPLETIRL